MRKKSNVVLDGRVNFYVSDVLSSIELIEQYQIVVVSLLVLYFVVFPPVGVGFDDLVDVPL